MFLNTTDKTNFKLEVEGNKSGNFTVTVQRATIPSFRITDTESPAHRGIHRKHVPGSSTEFDPLVVTFIVDENLSSYLDVYRWMMQINNYQTLSSAPMKEVLSNVTFHILDNNKVSIPVSFEYVEAWPMELGEMEYAYTDEGIMATTCTVTFMYNKSNVYLNKELVK